MDPGTCSEVSLCLEAYEKLKVEGIVTTHLFVGAKLVAGEVESFDGKHSNGPSQQSVATPRPCAARGIREHGRAMIVAQGKVIRTVLRWQVVAIGVMTLILGLLTGAHGAISAILGGLVSICAGLAFSSVVCLSKADPLAGTLTAALRAEAVKVAIAVLLLWVVFAVYKQVVAIALVASLAVSIRLFGMAFCVREA